MKKNTIKIKKSATNRESHTEEIKRYIGALSEDFQHGLSAVAEQVSGLNEKLDMEMKKVNAKLDTHTEMIGGMAVDIQEIKNVLEEKADKKSVALLEGRVSRIEELQKA